MVSFRRATGKLKTLSYSLSPTTLFFFILSERINTSSFTHLFCSSSVFARSGLALDALLHRIPTYAILLNLPKFFVAERREYKKFKFAVILIRFFWVVIVP